MGCSRICGRCCAAIKQKLLIKDPNLYAQIVTHLKSNKTFSPIPKLSHHPTILIILTNAVWNNYKLLLNSKSHFVKLSSQTSVCVLWYALCLGLSIWPNLFRIVNNNKAVLLLEHYNEPNFERNKTAICGKYSWSFEFAEVLSTWNNWTTSLIVCVCEQ